MFNIIIFIVRNFICYSIIHNNIVCIPDFSEQCAEKEIVLSKILFDKRN